MFAHWKKNYGLMLLMLVFAVTVVAGCAEDKTTTPDKTSGTPVDIHAKYDPPIEVTTVKSVNPTTQFADGETSDKNIWYDAYESELGIHVKNIWSIPAGQYKERANLAIASGDIPDFMEVNSLQLKQLVDLDLIMSLDDLLEQYGSDLTKKIMASDGGIGMKAATYNGKLMAIAEPAKPLDSSRMIWIRNDWLKNLNLPEPKTMDDLIKTAEAFVKNDPDKNGLADTIGFTFDKSIFTNGTADAFFNGYHAYPNIWVKDKDGKLANGSVLPEMKEALGKLQQLYKDGILDKEFAVKDIAKRNEAVVAGKVGIFFGGHGEIFNPLDPSFQQDGADWTAYPVMSADGEVAKTTMRTQIGIFFVISKKAKNPEAVFKLLNFNLEKQYGAAGRDMTFHNNDGKTAGRYAQAAIRLGDARQNIDIYLGVKKIFDTGSDEGVNFDGRNNYERIKDYLDTKNKLQWSTLKWSGPGGAMSIVDMYDKEKRYVQDEYFGPNTESMQEKSATLSKIMEETFLRIITGDADVNKFDEFVKSWNTLGGSDITKEVNEWFETQK